MASTDDDKLLALFARLPEAEQHTLLAFAEFLVAQQPEAAPQPFPEPQWQAGPEGESVVAAIKRLRQVYHMLNRDTIFQKTSTLMTAHIMEGRTATDVIAELEGLFAQEYQAQLAARQAQS